MLLCEASSSLLDNIQWRVPDVSKMLKQDAVLVYILEKQNAMISPCKLRRYA